MAVGLLENTPVLVLILNRHQLKRLDWIRSDEKPASGLIPMNHRLTGWIHN